MKITRIKQVDQELFGEWQTEPFVPPALLPNGGIPRNRFGNLEVFHSAMLPSGCAIVDCTWFLFL
jgi:hypothetical protein